MPAWSEPCTGAFAVRRQGRHTLQRNAKGPKKPGFCRECGAREDGHVGGDKLLRLDQAILAFRDASDALEPLLVSGDKDARLEAVIAWRRALTELRDAEVIGG